MATLSVAPPKAAPAFATATTSAIDLVGPVTTQAGFQYWYLACFGDTIIAVRQGIGAFFMFGLANGAAPGVFGLLGALINILAKSSSAKYRQRTEAALVRTRKASLQSKPNVSYQISQLKSISFKDVKFGGGLVLPEIILEPMSGQKQKYGIQKADFDKACALLKERYPHLCR